MIRKIIGLVCIWAAIFAAYRAGHLKGQLHALQWMEKELDKILKDEKGNNPEDKPMQGITGKND